jgi:hypothetical protein
MAMRTVDGSVAASAPACFNQALDRSLKSVSEGGSIEEAVDFLVTRGNALFRGRRATISFTGDGTMRFRYDGPLPRDAASFRTVFVQTNESYSARFLDILSEMRGANGYIGILGGADQHIQLLAALQRHNKLSNVTLVDEHDKQIIAGMLALSAYNSLGKDMRGAGSRWPGFVKQEEGVIDIDVKLVNDDIRNFLRRVDGGGYFVYLSNVLSFPLGHNPYMETSGALNLDNSRSALLAIQKNRNIWNGSAVMLTSPSDGNHLLLRKEEDRLRFAACDPKLTGVDRVELTYWMRGEDAFASSAGAVNEYLDVLQSRRKFFDLLSRHTRAFR